MDCQEIWEDLRATAASYSAQRQQSAQLLLRLNHTLPFSNRRRITPSSRELLGDRLGEGSIIAPPGAQVGHQV